MQKGPRHASRHEVSALVALIRQLGEAARMTQEGLATAAGIGRVTPVRIENGEQAPRYETLVALAGALGRSVGDLMAGEADGQEYCCR